MRKAKQILNSLKPNESLYLEKVKILTKLMEYPTGGHIIDSKLIKWADKVGIKTELSCEDRTSWWTCSMR